MRAPLPVKREALYGPSSYTYRCAFRTYYLLWRQYKADFVNSLWKAIHMPAPAIKPNWSSELIRRSAVSFVWLTQDELRLLMMRMGCPMSSASDPMSRLAMSQGGWSGGQAQPHAGDNLAPMIPPNPFHTAQTGPPTVDAFRDFGQEAAQRAAARAGNGSRAAEESSSRAGQANLATMYSPPFDLLFKGAFEEVSGMLGTVGWTRAIS